jgi:hypothetical protein
LVTFVDFLNVFFVIFFFVECLNSHN